MSTSIGNAVSSVNPRLFNAMKQADGFFHNDYAKLGQDAAQVWRDTGDSKAIATLFETGLKDYFVGDLADRYTAVALVETLNNRELKNLLQSEPRAARAIYGAVRKFPLESYDLEQFDRARVRVESALLQNAKPSGWRAP